MKWLLKLQLDQAQKLTSLFIWASTRVAYGVPSTSGRSFPRHTFGSLWFSISAFILDLSSSPPRFRAWTGTGREAGSSQTDTGRNATGAIDTATWMRDITGVLYASKAGRAVSGTGIDDEYDCLNIDLARVWGEHAGTEFAPTHIRIPAVFYLGNSA